MAFRRFFERFGGEAWFRRTIFVFVADHVSSEKFAPDTREYPGNMHIIGFLYTPDGALRGEVDDIVQQLDIMPTLLGLTGNDAPYFAVVRHRPAGSAGFVQHVASEGEIGGVVSFDDTDDRQTQGPPVSAADSLPGRFRALVQQYYTRIEQKDYTVHD